MESHLNTPSVRLQDAWISLGIFLGIFFGSIFISVFVNVESVFPELSPEFWLDLYATIALLMAVAYCISQYGTIHAEEFILRKRDVVVLGDSSIDRVLVIRSYCWARWHLLRST